MLDIDPGLESTVGPPARGRLRGGRHWRLPLAAGGVCHRLGSQGRERLRRWQRYWPDGAADPRRRPASCAARPIYADGWNHPGPALFYALALPYRLAGSHSVGLAVGALLINALAITGIALVARRVAGLPCMLVTLVGCAVLMRSLGPVFLRNPWNPYIAVLPFGLLVYLTWAMTCGEAWAFPSGSAWRPSASRRTSATRRLRLRSWCGGRPRWLCGPFTRGMNTGDERTRRSPR